MRIPLSFPVLHLITHPGHDASRCKPISTPTTPTSPNAGPAAPRAAGSQAWKARAKRPDFAGSPHGDGNAGSGRRTPESRYGSFGVETAFPGLRGHCLGWAGEYLKQAG